MLYAYACLGYTAVQYRDVYCIAYSNIVVFVGYWDRTFLYLYMAYTNGSISMFYVLYDIISNRYVYFKYIYTYTIYIFIITFILMRFYCCYYFI